MGKKFLVRAECSDSKVPNYFVVDQRLVAVIAVLVAALLYPHVWKKEAEADQFYDAVPLLIFLGVLLYGRARSINTTLGSVAVAVYPIGVQLMKRDVTGRCVQVPLFLPREDVLDCIVNEIILSQKVVSVAVIRVRGTASGKSFCRLVESFPGVEMSYEECLAMASLINNCL